MKPALSAPGVELDPLLRARLTQLHDEGRALWHRFDLEVRQQTWHPFVPADYATVLQVLLSLRGQELRFLEWGSATGIITITADLLGFDAYGIELDPDLVGVARSLAQKFHSSARFATGSYIPAGYEWRSATGDLRLGTIGLGTAAYLELDHALADFDLVFAYPWSGEEPIMHDIMRRFGGASARLLMNGTGGVRLYAGGRLQS